MAASRSGLVQVGDYLADVATKSKSAEHVDLFGRSAFNRYYYSAFLEVRSTLKTINNVWDTPAHRDIPVLLQGKVIKTLKEEIARAVGQRIIPQSEANSLLSSARTAATELARLLNSAREVRRVADYDPDELAAKIRTSVSLANYSLATAGQWHEKARLHSKTILKAYGRIGYI